MTKPQAWWRKRFSHPIYQVDSCGVGFIADSSGHRSHKILKLGIEAVENLTHRGASVDPDVRMGDGAGVLTQIPRKLFHRELAKLGVRLAHEADLAVGMLFLPQDAEAHKRCRKILETVARQRGLKVLGWRVVPTDPNALAPKALATAPRIEQVLLAKRNGLDEVAYERELYLVRKEATKRIEEEGIEGFYVPSFSHRTIVHKGLFVAPQLAKFYLDLEDPDYETAIALFHQRYSTNTLPTWPLAQPFRLLAHNGEINTLQGNRNWIRAREPELSSPIWKQEIEKLKPIIEPGGSDSASLDNVAEAAHHSGRDLLHTMMVLVPEAWQQMPGMDEELKGFYEYHACLTEPWDGPAALAFSDGVTVGAILDRNGLRPARYKITKSGIVLMGSEVGIVAIPDSEVVEKGRLGPGKMIAVDTAKRQILKDEAIKQQYSRAKPYARWVRDNMVRPEVKSLNTTLVPEGLAADQRLRLQKTFGINTEDLELVIKPMAQEGKEPTFSMGDDTPLAVLSTKPRKIYTYFKQRFAQVTNPPIDPLREKLVMSLNSAVGPRHSLFAEDPQVAKLAKFPSPVLTKPELEWLESLTDPVFASARIDCTLAAGLPAREGSGQAGKERLEQALQRVCEDAERALDAGKTILILSDRGVSAQRAPIPMALAVGGVHHFLIRKGKRMRASVVAETGDIFDVHHFSVLLGYGASLVYPYLAYETLQGMLEAGQLPHLNFQTALENYRKQCDSGILKIMSKMGISALSGYRGAQIFEVIGLDDAVVERCFAGSPSTIEGIGLEELEFDALRLHGSAFDLQQPVQLDPGGYYRFRKGGEQHAYSQVVMDALHKAVQQEDWNEYLRFAEAVKTREPICLRDLFVFKSDQKPIPLEEVEPIESIVTRFTTEGMSLGALSKEVHEALAIAMNRLGAKSNTGEGGEDPERFHVRPNGDNPNSAVKQVASGRFGVTPEYLAAAKELEIKMAQGSKPGEGGQLPGTKVTEEIARIRHTKSGVTLISPPPHHDIYSIEDLAQLIYDLKQVNPRAKVGVKLVSEAGVGTIACGVAKAFADVVLIAGHDGGTGASPLSSIKNAGSAWELGLAETQQLLMMNHLRHRITVRVDGGMKSGRDVIIGAILGAEEYGFGSCALVAANCCMVRQCHLNTCPVGVATQDPKLRAKFRGAPEHVVTYFLYVAQEVRQWLAQLGFRHVQDIIGRTELLGWEPRADHPKTARLDLSPILAQVDTTETAPRVHTLERNDRVDSPLDDTILQDAKDAIQHKMKVRLHYPVKNTNRDVGTRLSGEIAFHYGDAGLPEGLIEVVCEGSAGQSFGAFLIEGVRLILIGEANDYVGKGIHGGEIAILPPPDAAFSTWENVIIGNTVMYGATGGALYAAGMAGERFCVRNSGGRAVIEGVGDHGCEYMTGGVVVVLGKTGRNFGAGMTGGAAYVLDTDGTFEQRYNLELVKLERLGLPEDIDLVKSMIARHVELTQSRYAQEILDRWYRYERLFWKVFPKAAVPKPQPAAISKV